MTPDARARSRTAETKADPTPFCRQAGVTYSFKPRRRTTVLHAQDRGDLRDADNPMAYLVNQRFQEFGIRMALGAQARDILMLALRPGLVLLCTGTAIGLVASIFVAQLMSSLLFGVSASDPFTFAVVPLVLGLTTLVATLIPARSAVRVSPAQALKF